MKTKDDIQKYCPGEWNEKIINDDVDLIVGNFKQASKDFQIIDHIIKNTFMKRKRFSGRTISSFQTSANQE
jgi:hypothetical protein